MLAERIAELVTPAVEAMGFELVRVQVSGSQRPTVQIMAEPASGRAMSVDDCAEISRAVSAVLDGVGRRLDQAPRLSELNEWLPFQRSEDLDIFAGALRSPAPP